MQSKIAFTFRCRDQAGRTQQGVLEAESAEQALESLRERGWTVSQLSPQNKALLPKPTPPAGAAPRQRLPEARQLVAFCAQLATLLEGGLPLLRALSTLERQADPALKELARHLCKQIERGNNLSAALRFWPECFEPGFVAAVAMGESNGKLVAVIRRLADNLQMQSQRQGRLRAALVYPGFLALSCVVMLIFMMTYLLPLLLKLIPAGVEPPWPTRVVIAMSQLPLVPLAVTFSVVSLWASSYLRSVEGRAWREWLLRGPLPWGGHFRRALWVELVQSLQLMVTSGVAAAQTLPALNEAAGPQLAPVLKRSQQRFLQGAALSDSLQPESTVPPMLIALVQVGESVGRMEHFLAMFVRVCEEEVELEREAFLSLLEPVMLVTLGGLVGFVVMAAFLPSYQLLMIQ